MKDIQEDEFVGELAGTLHTLAEVVSILSTSTQTVPQSLTSAIEKLSNKLLSTIK
jgi:hypothetical protein